MAQPIIKICYYKDTREYRVVTRDTGNGHRFIETYMVLNPVQLAWIVQHNAGRHESSRMIEWVDKKYVDT